MDTAYQFELLKEAYSDDPELSQVLAKLLDIALGQQRLRLKRYERDLREFEKRFGMDSQAFYQKFEAGELGDDMNLFEWAGLLELYQDLLKKINRLELAL
ncbi:MAG: hypothetical protein AB1894_04270 [Chloroflexota bacterium]